MIADRLGWTCIKQRVDNGRSGTPEVHADTQRVRRALGLVEDSGQPKRKNGAIYKRKPRTRIHEDTALKLAEAIGLFPVDIGL